MGDTKSIVPASEESSAPAPSESNKNVITQNTEEAPYISKPKPKNQQNKPPEETKPVIDENALYKPNTNKGENEGITGKPGNQGNRYQSADRGRRRSGCRRCVDRRRRISIYPLSV